MFNNNARECPEIFAECDKYMVDIIKRQLGCICLSPTALYD